MGIVELIGTIILGGLTLIFCILGVICIIGLFIEGLVRDYRMDPAGCKGQIIFFSIILLGIACLAIGKTYGI